MAPSFREVDPRPEFKFTPGACGGRTQTQAARLRGTPYPGWRGARVPHPEHCQRLAPRHSVIYLQAAQWMAHPMWGMCSKSILAFHCEIACRNFFLIILAALVVFLLISQGCFFMSLEHITLHVWIPRWTLFVYSSFFFLICLSPSGSVSTSLFTRIVTLSVSLAACHCSLCLCLSPIAVFP